MPELYRVGFRIEYYSENKWRITGVPAMSKNLDASDIIMKMIDAVNDTGSNYGKDSSIANPLSGKLALVMARSSAIKSGQKLTREEMEHIVVSLFSLPDPLYTPNGNKIYYLIDENKLDNMFN